MPEMQRRLSDEVAAFREVFEGSGSFLLLSFLDACLSGYEGKIDYRDFTDAEREELLTNALRMMQLLEADEEE